MDVCFETLRALAVERGLDLEGLKRETGCCRGCGMCEPYIRLVLATGRTRFPVLSRDQMERMLGGVPARAGAADTTSP